MRNDKLIPGMILVMIGAIFLLNNFGYINFHWSNIFHLWPIFLVIGGVNLVFANNKSPWATILKISVVVAGFALLIFGNFGDRYRWWWPGHYTYHYNRDKDNDDNNDNDNNDSDDNDDDDDNGGKLTKVEGNAAYTEPYNASVRVARLNISGGGSTYSIQDTTNQLFTANTKEFFGKYQYDHHQEDSVYVMDFSMKDNKNGHWNWGKGDKSNIADLKLNTNPEWEINVETGASKIDFDLSKYKLRSLELKGGAASFDVKVGQPLASTNLNISTGVSEVTIEVPQNAACRVETDSGLSSTSFEGLTKKDDGHYESPGFDAAKNKLYIHMSGGISDFKVRRY
jgi:hypothetical protein